jgi:hypothetical protein
MATTRPPTLPPLPEEDGSPFLRSNGVELGTTRGRATAPRSPSPLRVSRVLNEGAGATKASWGGLGGGGSPASASRDRDGWSDASNTRRSADADSDNDVSSVGADSRGDSVGARGGDSVHRRHGSSCGTSDGGCSEGAEGAGPMKARPFATPSPGALELPGASRALGIRGPGSVMTTASRAAARAAASLSSGPSDAILPLARAAAALVAPASTPESRARPRTFDSVLASFPRSQQFAIREMILVGGWCGCGGGGVRGGVWGLQTGAGVAQCCVSAKR